MKDVRAMAEATSKGMADFASKETRNSTGIWAV